jgi:excisionase family DNA binding protein
MSGEYDLDDTWLLVGSAAHRLGVSPQTIVRWCNAGKLDYTRLDSGHRRISARSVQEILDGEIGTDTRRLP